MRTEAEVYRFTWRSGFDGDAAVRMSDSGYGRKGAVVPAGGEAAR